MEENVVFTKENVDALVGRSSSGHEVIDTSLEKQEDVLKTEVSKEDVKVEAKEPVVDEVKEIPKEVVKEPVDSEFEERWNRKFSALSRRERHLSQKEKEANDKLRLSDTESKELGELRKFRSRFDEDPYGVMDEKGNTYEKWTKKILQGDIHPKSDQGVKELESIKKDLEEFKQDRTKQNESHVLAQRQHTYNQQMGEINKVINEKKEELPLVNLFGDEQLIFDIRAEKFRQDLEEVDKEYAMENLMSIEDAASHAEAWRETVLKEKKAVIDPFKKKLEGLFSQEEIKEREALKKVEGGDATKKPQGAGTLPERTQRLLGVRKAKTLTNEQQTTVPARETKPFKTEQERLDHAASFIRFEGV